jgi:GDPmannose 4,6-dehydratase
MSEQDSTKQKVAFITGITGMDGSHLADYLLYKGYKVVGLRRRTSTFNTERVEHIYNNPRFIMEWGNVLDSYSLYKLLEKHRPDEIYNLAAQSHVRVSFDVPEETLEVVSMGTLKLLNAFKDVCPESKFYQASSSEMYGDNPTFPQNESTRMTPASPYACAKLCAHNLARNYRESYGLFISCGILFNHEGPRRSETFVTRKITKTVAKIKLGLEKELSLGNLDAQRDWGLAEDYVKGMYLMLQQQTPDDFVLATGETHSVKDFVEETFALAELNPWDYVKVDQRLFRPHEVPLLLGDYSKAKRVLGWEPTVKFKELVKIMYEEDLKAQRKQWSIGAFKIELEQK